MLKQLLVIGFIAVIWSNSTFACLPVPIGRIQNLDKIVAIELNPDKQLNKGAKSSWVMDDDGMLVIGLIASVCAKGMPDLKLELDSEALNCFHAAQDNPENQITDPERLHTDFYDPKFREKKRAQEVISRTCGIKAIQLWEAALAKEDQIELPCFKNNPDLIALVQKATKRNADYVAETTSSQLLERAEMGKQAKQEYIEKRKEELKLSKELQGLLSSSTKVSVFRKWLESFKKMIEFKGYQIRDNPEVTFDGKMQETLDEIFIRLGSNLGSYSSNCNFPTNIGSILSSASWSSAGAPLAPAAPPAPAPGATR